MKISDRIKIKLMIMRFTYEELLSIQKFINDEVRKRNKHLVKLKHVK